jgi:hypothetical protein
MGVGLLRMEREMIDEERGISGVMPLASERER